MSDFLTPPVLGVGEGVGGPCNWRLSSISEALLGGPWKVANAALFLTC